MGGWLQGNKKADPLGVGFFGNWDRLRDQAVGGASFSLALGIMKRKRILPRLAVARALRLRRSLAVSWLRRRRTSSRMPSISSLVLRRLRARSTGSPLRTWTSGILSVVRVKLKLGR